MFNNEPVLKQCQDNEKKAVLFEVVVDSGLTKLEKLFLIGAEVNRAF